MNHLKLIHQYLEEKESLEAIPPTGYPFVTISRQGGAGGHLLAHVLMTDFLAEANQGLFGGWHVFDRELCEIVAEDPELHTTMENLLGERYRSEFSDFMEGLFSGRSEQYLLCKKTFRIVRILGLLGKVVIVGRAGAMVTRDLPQGIHIRLVAPQVARVRWMMRKLKLSKEAAERAVRKQDADRRRMMRAFFNRDVDDPLIYDVVWNSEKSDPHEIAHAVIEMIKLRAAKQRQKNKSSAT